MKPVNLLPAKSRPRTPTGSLQGSSYIVIGILGALLIMTLVYVTTVNGISSKKTAVARAKAETQQAQARAGSLAGYGNFSQIKQQRVSSVEQLAAGRVDWERLARGLARVLPDGVWILTANASASASASASGTGGTPSTSGNSGTSSSQGSSGSSSGGPSVQLSGCAPSQDIVATTLVRLKELSGATDVQLNEVTQPDTAQASGGTTGSGSSGGTDCGQSHGQPNYNWTATVSFAPLSGSAPNGTDKVPASLGGGS
jgi:Tfp pilus assembly protein PilN